MMTTRRKRNAQIDNQDDLTRIRGIGEARQQWLWENLKVDSFQALAALSIEDIEARLKEDNQIVSRAAIEAWITEAAQLAGAPASRHPVMSKDVGWRPIASFVVEFQENEITPERRTKVHHIEADKNRMWSSFEQAELCAWMVEQLDRRDIPVAEPSPDLSPAIEIKPYTASENEPAIFSEKLQQVLAKAERLRLAALPLMIPGHPTATHEERPVPSLSQGLRAALAKADALSAESN
jgi:hypothetical protein